MRSYQGRGSSLTGSNCGPRGSLQLGGVMTGQPMHRVKHDLIKKFNLDQAANDTHTNFAEKDAGTFDAIARGTKRNRNSFTGKAPTSSKANSRGGPGPGTFGLPPGPARRNMSKDRPRMPHLMVPSGNRNATHGQGFGQPDGMLLV